MPIDVSCRRVFLATPGGMEHDRDVVRAAVEAFNRRTVERTGVVFVVTGFEDRAGTMIRPQEAINELVRKSDYMITLIGDEMGSYTTTEPPFMTGIEEEMTVAVGGLERADQAMRDIMLAFQAQPPYKTREPSQKLQEVLEFKSAFESTKVGLHVGAYSGEAELRERLSLQLERWAEPLPVKEGGLRPALRAVLDRSTRPTMSEPPSQDAEGLVAWAEQQAALGFNTIAESAFAQAIADEQPEPLSRFARFLQRTGQLDRALALDQRALRASTGTPDDSAEAVEVRADILGHIGLLKRKLGNPKAARKVVREAVELAGPHADEMPRTLCYALDQLGIISARQGDLDAAQAAYEEALELRERVGDAADQAQSLVNLARLERQRGDDALAVARLERAVILLDTGTDSRVLANALASLGDALRDDDATRAIELLTRALEINRQLDIPDGVGVAVNCLARIALAEGDIPRAFALAQQVLELASDSGNREGQTVAYQLIGEILLANGEADKAVSALDRSIQLSVEQHDRAREGRSRLVTSEAYIALRDLDEASRQRDLGLAAAGEAGDHRTQAKLEELRVSPD